ncbi:MAG: phosphorylase, partial [Steroidobacteraceae bacterium]
RVPNGQSVAVVHAYMAHHQGMSLVALDNVLNDSMMQERFHADPRVAAADLLLQERRIRFVEAPAFVEADVPATRAPEDAPEVARTVEGYDSPTPIMHLLSNRHYSVMVTDSGGGYSSCLGRAVTRWREDATRDCWGTFIYLRDAEEERTWSAGFQPTAAEPDEYHVHFNEESVAIARRDGQLRTTMTVVVAPEDDGELRQVTLRNDGLRARQVELTTYAEIVLAPQRADIAHPGFSNLFVQTEYVPDCGALLATRRPRSDRESAVWAAHVIAGVALDIQGIQYETDRARFVGRGRGTRDPQAMQPGQVLSNTVGNVLDPVFSLRTYLTVPARGTATVTIATFMAATREQVLELVSRYRAPALFEHVMQSAWTFARAELHYLASTLGEARLFQTLVAHLLVDTQQLRSAPASQATNTLDVTHLWRFAISGDRPILLIRCHSNDDLPFLRQCLRAQEYLRVKQVIVDVVVLNERRHSYMQDLQQAIEHTTREFSSHANEGGERGGIYPLTVDGVGESERQLLLSLARVVLDPSEGSLLELLSRPPKTRSPEPLELPRHPVPPALPAPAASPGRGALEFFNGWGGFAAEGREYALSVGPGTPATPAPWSNVLANEGFGALVTERGSMCTWSLNSRENQLTPWSNDPVSDPSGECFYLRDEDGEVWSPAPQPIQLPQVRYDICHGQGYSRFGLSRGGIETSLTVFVANNDPVKICHLRIINRRPDKRQLRFASYVEWTLGAARVGTNRNLQTRMDPTTGAQFARNPALIDFGSRVAFCDLGGRQQYCSDSRHEFLGRNGSTAAPAGLADPSNWSIAHGPGHDACCVFAVDLELAAGATEDIVFVLGQAGSDDEARQLVLAYRRQDPAGLLREVQQHWDQLLGAVQIRTPDRGLDVLFNRWLMYQTIACRLWGRAAFYQAGGAYGFRDQLQDVMAVMQAAPALARAQLLRAAARQFPEGDAQHWWHPPSGRGVRTHISDDRIWLPYVLCHYLDCTHDRAVLDELVPFIEGPLLTQEQEDSHYVPQRSPIEASLYEHSARALDVSMALGAHGLPLMGGGDWNDGMNRVGHAGKGESVWLAWLLIATLERFIPVALSRGDEARAATWRLHREALIAACEREAWDGQWYRRAYFDDGTPLGSSTNTECRIDSLSQSWAVLSGAAEPGRARQAMTAVEQQLQRDEDGIVLLFTPPFDTAPHDPGYIKGYLPGLRENGGQYTHAAVWVLMAQARLGRSDQVEKLLRILNPVKHAESRAAAQAYRVEPYVLAADVYSGLGLAGRGGWTWYTGAAGWMYRAVLESVLGVQIRADTLAIAPCVPDAWPGFEVDINLPGVQYRVQMRRDNVAAMQLLLDDAPVAGELVPLLRDGRLHHVQVVLPQAAGTGR